MGDRPKARPLHETTKTRKKVDNVYNVILLHVRVTAVAMEMQ